MKKIFISLAVVLAVLASCNPAEDSYSNNAKNYTEEALSDCFTFTQANESGTPAEDGNYFTFNTSPSTIVTVLTKNDDGSENILSKGSATGTFAIVPRRGANPSQTFYVRSMNADGSWTEVEKTANVFVPSDLTPEMKLLASDSYGSKIWTWDTEFRADGGAWGNMGYACGSGDTFADAGNGIWFACFPDYLENPNPEDGKNQMNHSDSDTPLGEGVGAYMEFFDDGKIITYSKDGKQIRTGKYSVEGYTGERNHPSIDGSQTEWSLGTLKTDAGTILWPFEINWKDNNRPACPTEFEIMQLDVNHLKLIYAKPGTSGWGEATWWAFKSESDAEAALTDFDTKSWTWDTEFRADGGAWGNMGYACGSGDTFANAGNGIWWGCNPDYLENPNPEDGKTQMQHAGDGATPLGEGVGAYMTFDINKGLVTSYNKDGNQIRQGKFEIQKWDRGKRHLATVDGSQPVWALGKLHTDAGSILWPFKINGAGTKPTDFEIMQLNGDHLKLIYAAPDVAGWGEATWWAFKKK